MGVIIVTGASSGIGRACAERLARSGMVVVAAARRADLLTDVVAGMERGVAVPADLRDPAAIDALVARALEVDGRIDGLVNNAGVGGSPSLFAGDAEVDAMIETNLRAPMRLMRAVVPVMREQRSGGIVNIGSVAGEIGISGTYSATKFALRGMTDSVRRELAGTGIGVTLIEPGYIATGMARDRPGSPGPEVVAAAVERALRRPRRRIVVPVKFRAAMLVAAAFPAIVDRVYAGRAGRRG